MKVMRLKINSSVVILNISIILVTIGAAIAAWVTGNEAMLKELLGPEATALLITLSSIATIYFRTTGLKGLPPIEILPAEDKSPTLKE